MSCIFTTVSRNESPITMFSCNPSVISYPILENAVVLSLPTQLVTNYSHEVTPNNYPNHGSLDAKELSFCNITVSYTRQQDDHVSVETWLPPLEHWNGRLQAAGGSSRVGPGRFNTSYGNMAGAIAEAMLLLAQTLELATP